MELSRISQKAAVSLLALIGLTSQQVLSRDINAITAERSALVGQGYQSEKEYLVSQSCVQGTAQPSGIATSTISFDTSLSEKEASDHLGFGLGGRVRYGVVEAKAAARFARSSVSSAYSVSSVWVSEYRLPSEKLTAVTLSSIGEAVRKNPERWARTCGDEYVDEITKGAKLFFSIRVEFASREQKQSFEAKFSLSGPLYSANADLTQASREFSRDARVFVSAFQIGGDVEKVTALFGDSDTARAGFVECALGDFQKCSKVIAGALAYAADTKNGFPSQLTTKSKPGGVPIVYKTAPYSDAGIYIDNYPYLMEVTKLARERLAAHFEQQFGWAVQSDRLIAAGLGKDKLEALTVFKKLVDANLSRILEVSKVCYDQVLECKGAVDKLELARVDETVLEYPPMVRASYRIYTTYKGLMSRTESVSIMQDFKRKFPTTTPPALDISKCEPSRLPSFPSLYSVALSQMRRDADAASVVLYVEGTALRSATLYFENRKLREFSLQKGADSYPEKFGDNFAMLIVDTTRLLKGWQDIDINDALEDVSSSKDRKAIQDGEGRFYVRILDAFGRQTSVDLMYSEWRTCSAAAKLTLMRIYLRHNWWDPGSDGGNALVPNDPAATALRTFHFFR